MSVIQAALITNPFRKVILHLWWWIKFFCLCAGFEGDLHSQIIEVLLQTLCCSHSSAGESVLLNSCIWCSEFVSEKCDVSQQLLHSEYGLLTESLLYVMYWRSFFSDDVNDFENCILLTIIYVSALVWPCYQVYLYTRGSVPDSLWNNSYWLISVSWFPAICESFI